LNGFIDLAIKNFYLNILGLPIVLAHAIVITIPAMIMSIGGGALVYSTSKIY